MNNVLLSLPPSIQAQQPRIGLVVDDAIVVVEAVEHHIEQGLDPKRASLKAMEEISGPGARDRLHPDDLHPRNHRPSLSTIRRYHRHFGNALGVQCADSQPGAGRSAAETAYAESRSAAPVLRCLQRYFERSTESYLRWARVLIDKGAVAFAVLALAGVGAALISQRIPSSFLPVEDQGYLFMHMQLPTGASLERTEAAAQKIEQVLAHTPGVKYTTSVLGLSLLNQVATTYMGFFFVTLDEWGARRSRQTQYQEIVQHLNRELSRIPDGLAFSFPPPAILGVGTSGGFTFVLEDRAGKDVPFLAENVQKFMAAASKRPEIAPGMVSTFLPAVPQQFLNVDRERVLKQ